VYRYSPSNNKKQRLKQFERWDLGSVAYAGLFAFHTVLLRWGTWPTLLYKFFYGSALVMAVAAAMAMLFYSNRKGWLK